MSRQELIVHSRARKAALHKGLPQPGIEEPRTADRSASGNFAQRLLALGQLSSREGANFLCMQETGKLLPSPSQCGQKVSVDEELP